METPGKMGSSDGLAKHWAFRGIWGQIGTISKDMSLVAWPLAETMSEPLAKTSLLQETKTKQQRQQYLTICAFLEPLGVGTGKPNPAGDSIWSQC